jgi:hypothetical protein
LQTFNDTKHIAIEKKLEQSYESEEKITELGELNKASTNALLQRASIAPSTDLVEEPMLQGAKRAKLEVSSHLDDGQPV